MKRLLLLLIGAFLLALVLVPASQKAEAAEGAVIDVKKITRGFNFSDLKVYDDRLIAIYKGEYYEPSVISSYSKTGTLDWEKSVEGFYATAEDRYVTIENNKLSIHSTATGEVLKTIGFPGGFYEGLISKVEMNEKYILITGKSSSQKVLTYDINGKLVLNAYTEGVTKAALYKDTVLYQNSKGLYSINIVTRQKLWHVPLDSSMKNIVNLLPVNNTIYIGGFEKYNETDSAPTKQVVKAIDASTGALLYKKEFGKYEETIIQAKDFGLITSHYIEDIHHFYGSTGTLKMTLSMESPELKQFKQKNRITGLDYNFLYNFYDSQNFLYYFKTYSGVYDEYVFSTVQLFDKTGSVKFEKVLEDYVYGIAATDSAQLFVAHGLGEYANSNKLNVYDSKGILLETMETGFIGDLQTDGSQVYGYGGNALYIFKSNGLSGQSVQNVPSINPLSNKDTVLSGKAEPDAKVYAYAGGKLIGEATAVNGVFSIKVLQQPAGTAVDVYVMGRAENMSAKKTIKVSDKIAPALPSVNTVSDKSTAISGKAETNAKVYAYAGEKKLGEATAKSGAYSILIAKQKAGTSISLYAADSAGNKSAKKTIKVIDKTAPAVPIVSTVSDKSVAITGKAESGAKVHVYAGSKKLGETTAKSGVFSLNITKQKAGTSIAVYAIDAANNKSGSRYVKVADKTAPLAPTVNKVTSKTTTVSGKGEKAAAILIYNGSKKIGQATVDSYGSFKVKIGTQKKGSYLKVYAQDKAGNKSGSRTVKVY